MLMAEDISVTLDGKPILKDVSLGLAPGEFLCLLGPNGAGKSTLVKAMTGEMAPDEGKVTLNDRPVRSYRYDELAACRGVLSQHTELAFAFTAAEVVALGDRGGRRSADLEQWALAQVGLDEKAGQSYQTLSGGEQQRVHLARVLLQLRTNRRANRPQCLILDEPTASLDLAYQHHVLDLARQLARSGLAVMAVLHDINQAARYADRIAILRQGRLAVEGTPAEVVTAETISDVYGLAVQRLDHPQTGQPFIVPA